MIRDRRAIGKAGEDAAAAHLALQGYRLISRNYRCTLGELDLIVEKGDELVFVEVRSKQQPCLFDPEESISRDKARRLIRLAEYYTSSVDTRERPWRIDVVAVEFGVSGEMVRLDHYKDATSAVLS